MRMSAVLCLFSIVVALSPELAAQQNPAFYQTGLPINAAQISIPLGVVNALTGNVHLEIPIAEIPERNGIPVKAKLTYDTSIAKNYGNGYQGGGGWSFVYGTDEEARVVFWDTVQVPCLLAQYPYGGNLKYTNFVAKDRNGQHQVVLSNGTSWPGYTLKIGCYDSNGNYENPADGTSPSASGSDIDGLGYFLSITNYNIVKATAGNGTVFMDPAIINNQPYDTNGNIMWTANGDTLGRKPVTTSNQPWCHSTSPVYIYVKASDGSTQTYSMTCGAYTIGTSTLYYPTSLVLPNSTQYSFTWDTGSHFGVLTSVTLPTGGQVSFSYNVSGTNVSSVTDGGGTWTFSYAMTVAGQNSQTTTTVTTPSRYDYASRTYLSDKSVYSSVLGGMPFLQTAQYFSGSSALLKTISITYTGPLTAFPATATTTLNDTGQSSKIQYSYVTYLRDHPSQIQEWDYGASTPTRTTKISYGVYNKPTSVGIYAGDGSGSPLSATTYTYDEYSASYCKNNVPMLTSVTGATSHDDANHGSSFTNRGNLTSISHWVSGTTWVTAHRCYDTLGNVTQVVDENGNPITYDYTERWADVGCIPGGTLTRGYPTTLTDALGHRKKTTYFSCTGLAQANADDNDINAVRPGTTFSYDGLGRRLCTIFPDTGQTCTSYSDTTSPVSSTTTTQINSGVAPLTQKAVFDGYGRTIQTQLTSDPEGTDYVDITYDALGHKASQTNAYRTTSDPTYGITNYYYDALTRNATQVFPDASTSTTTFSGNTAMVTDPAGQERKTQTDVFGRLTTVWEDPTVLNYETDYTYDVLGNLLCVQQRGGSTTPSGTGCAYSASAIPVAPGASVVSPMMACQGLELQLVRNPASCGHPIAMTMSVTY